MTAAPATDRPESEPVLYQFKWLDNFGAPGQSNWQTSRTFTMAVAGPNLPYTYWTRSRDSANPANATDWSDPRVPATP